MVRRVYKVDPINPDVSVLREVAREVAKGAVIIYPTDTVYGVGGLIFKEDVLERIARIKGRSKPFPIAVDSLESAMKIGVFSEKAVKLAKTFWPGPLTIKVYARMNLSKLLMDPEGKVAVRVPGSNVAISLARLCGGFIVSTSANKTGLKPPRSLSEALEQIGDEVDIAIDSGLAPHGVPSTIIDVTKEPPVIVRVGALSKSVIERVVGEVRVEL